MRHLLTIVLLLAALGWGMATGVNRHRPDESATVTDDSLCMELKTMADTASPEVKYRIATFLEHDGAEVCGDTLLALKYLTEAADSGYAPALNYLGFKYFTGDGVPADSLYGLSLIRKAAESGDPRSYNNLGWLYLQGTGVPQDYSEAARWFECASRKGVPTASAMLGDMHRDGLGMPVDTARADSLYNLAIKRGLSDAQLRLIDLRRNDWKTLSADSAVKLGLTFYPAPGPAVGVVLFEHAADLGNPRAMALLGDAFSRGVGVAYDHNRSLTWFYKAALAGNPSAQFVIAELLDMFPDALSDIVPLIDEPYIIDDPQYWYSRAALAGISDAAAATEYLLQKP